MMIDRKDKRYVSCPVCGRILMKCQGQCKIDLKYSVLKEIAKALDTSVSYLSGEQDEDIDDEVMQMAITLQQIRASRFYHFFLCRSVVKLLTRGMTG